MIDVSTASSLAALLFIGFGEWMIVAWFARWARGRPTRRYPHWLPGVVLIILGASGLVLAAGGIFASNEIFPVVAFWVSIGLLVELPVILTWIWYWPEGIRWGMERRSLNPPTPFIVSSSAGALCSPALLRWR
jgi:hypothetical protein